MKKTNKALWSALMVAVVAGTSFGQVGLSDGKKPDNPCDQSPPTRGSCWDCFRKLLKACRSLAGERDSTKEEREACFEGALDDFHWCRGQIPGSRPVGPRVAPPANGTNPPKGNNGDDDGARRRRSGLVLPERVWVGEGEFLVPITTTAASVEAFVITADGEIAPDGVFQMADGTGGATGFWLMWNDLPHEQYVTVVALDSHDQMTVGEVEQYYRSDLNQDFTLDTVDFQLALDRTISGRWSSGQFQDWLDEFFAGE